MSQNNIIYTAIKRGLSAAVISLLLFCNGYSQIVFAPLTDESTFKGKWKISEDIPNYLAVYMRELQGMNVISASSFLSLLPEQDRDPATYSDIEYISKIPIDTSFRYIVFGKISDFSIQKFNAGESGLGGYERYAVNIELDIKIFPLNRYGTAISDEVTAEASRNSLGLTLFGKPTADREQYFGLNLIKFGSEEFSKTLPGEAMLLLAENFVSVLKANKLDLTSFAKETTKKERTPADTTLDDIHISTELIKGTLLLYDEVTGETFINLGSAHNLVVGEEFGIYTEGDSLYDPSTNEFLGVTDKKVAVLEVVEVRGEKLSLCVVKENRKNVRKGMLVKKIFIKK